MAVIFVRYGSFLAIALPALAILPLLWYWSPRSVSATNGKNGNKAAVMAKPSVAPGLLTSDKHLDEVRTWLRENTNSGQWEEVRWWPVRDVKTRIDGVVHAGRLKYRTQTGFGKRLNDDIFVFHDNGRLDWSHASKALRSDDGSTAETVKEIVEAIDAEDDRSKK